MEYFLYDYLSPQELAGFDRYKVRIKVALLLVFVPQNMALS